MKLSNITPSYFILIVSIMSLAGVFIACEKEAASPNEMVVDENTSPGQLSWLMPTEDGQIKRSELFVYSEGIIGSSEVPGYRVSGRFWDEENDQPVEATSIRIGDITIPVDENGNFHESYGPFYNEADWNLLQGYPNRNVTVQVEGQDGLIQEFELNIAPPLLSTASQEGVNPFLVNEIDGSKDLVIEWPVPADQNVGFRDGERVEDFVGGTIVYQPQTSRRVTGLTSLPTSTISRSKSSPFGSGKLTFTREDLKLLPDNGLVTIYVGRVRYRVDSKGKPVKEPFRTSGGGGSTGGGTGGVEGGPRIVVNHK